MALLLYSWLIHYPALKYYVCLLLHSPSAPSLSSSLKSYTYASHAKLLSQLDFVFFLLQSVRQQQLPFLTVVPFFLFFLVRYASMWWWWRWDTLYFTTLTAFHVSAHMTAFEEYKKHLTYVSIPCFHTLYRNMCSPSTYISKSFSL